MRPAWGVRGCAQEPPDLGKITQTVGEGRGSAVVIAVLQGRGHCLVGGDDIIFSTATLMLGGQEADKMRQIPRTRLRLGDGHKKPIVLVQELHGANDGEVAVLDASSST